MRSSSPAYTAASVLVGASKRVVSSFVGNRRGAVAAYVGTAAVALFGVGVLSIDVGQMVIMRNQMQNAADSAALGAAAHLIGRSGSIQRATEVAQNLALDDSKFASNGTSLTVSSVTLYSTFDRDDPSLNVVTTVDQDAVFIRVDLAPKNMNFLLEPVLDGLLGESDQDFTTLNAYAVAQYAQMDCDSIPLFVCSTTDDTDPVSVFHNDNIGKMLVIKMGAGSPLDGANGNFGMLQPVDVDGSFIPGANAVNDSLEALTYPGCLTSAANTAPGAQTQQVRWGINARFGTGGAQVNDDFAADNVISYPRDTLFAGVPGGRGGSDPAMDMDGSWAPETHWDPETWWSDMYQQHDAFGFPMYDGFGNPIMLMGGDGFQIEPYATVRQDIIDAHPNNPNGYVTRFGMYLWHLADETHYMVEDNVSPMSLDPNDCSNEPSCAGLFERRILKIAVIDCGDGTGGTQLINGATAIDIRGKYLDVFLTEEVPDPGVGDASVLAEIVGDSSGDSGGSQAEISNVRLVD